ncbi:MAG: hypothetical protein ACK4V8_00010 [Moraxella osloensis]
MSLKQFVLASEQSPRATAHRQAVRIAKIKAALKTFGAWLLLMVCAVVLTFAFAPIKAALAGQSSEQHIEIVRKPQPDVVPTFYK